MSSALSEDRMPWYHNPNRKCLNDYRFTNLPNGAGAEAVKGELAFLCMTCPVFKECYADAKKAHDDGRLKDVFQGGQEWR